MSNLKIYLTGDTSTITSADAKSCALIAQDYEVDQDGLLLFSQISYKVRKSIEAGAFGNSGAVAAGVFTSISYKFGGRHQDIGSGSDRSSTGEVCIEVCNGMWASVGILRHVKDASVIEVARRGTYKRRSPFKFWRYIKFRLCRCRSKGTLSC